jgi:putative peptide zinc metalloprotease protein
LRIVEEEIRDRKEQIARAREKIEALQIRSPSEGFLVIQRPEDLPGRYLKKGELVGYVVAPRRAIIRAVVNQEDVDVVRNQTRRVQVRPAEQLDAVLTGIVKREVPAGADLLPSPILGTIGGGAIAVDPRDEKGSRALRKLFQFDIELERPLDQVFVGGRVHLRFDHGSRPLAERIYRRIRQTFLKRFNV